MRSLSDACGLSRRDFVEGALVATGGLAFGSLAPQRAVAATAACGDALAGDARLLRGGNLPSVFAIGHLMRDGRLTFRRDDVIVAAGCDGREGASPIMDDGEEADVIVVGGGLGGLSAAFYLLRRRPDIKLRILEANQFLGGNASCDDSPPLPLRVSSCGAYAAAPYTDYLKELYALTGVSPEKYPIKSPFDSYFFDEHIPGVKPGCRGWRTDLLPSLRKGARTNFADAPYDEKIMRDLARCADALAAFHEMSGGPDEPPELSHPKFDELATMSFADYLTKVLRCDPLVVDFFTVYTVDCMGGTARDVNAHTAISFLSSGEAGEAFAYPGGTAQIASQLQKWLVSGGPAGRAAARIDAGATALHVEADLQLSKNRVGVIYYKDGAFRRASSKTLVVATPPHVGKRIIGHLLEGERKAAWDEFNTAPALCANVALRNMRPLVDLGLGYSNYWWGGKYWSNFIIADWTTDRRRDPDRASALTLYSHVSVPKEEFAAERMKLLTTPFKDFEASLEEDLSRLFRGTTFDFRKDVSAIFLYRWGHSMILAAPKSVFGNVRDARGRLIRARAPRRIACRPLGPISFAGQHTEGTPSVESAIASGHRAALEVIAQL